MRPAFFSRLHAAAALIFKSGAPFPFNKIMPYDAMGGERMYRAFEQSTWVMRAIKKIAGPIAAVDLHFARDGQRFHDADLEAYWETPGAGLSRSDLIEATVGWLKLEGEAFWLLDDSWLAGMGPHGTGSCPATAATPLQMARPDRMRHVVNNGELEGWEYTDAAGRRALLLPEQVVQLKMWNPYSDFRGMAELKPCRDAAEADYLAGKFNLNLMRNNGDQGAYVIAKDGLPLDGQRQQIIDQIREKRELAQRGVFKPVFLDGDITIEDPKIRVPDADFIAARLQNRHEVFIAMGVPPSMADVKASYSIGSASDWFMLIAETCIPLGEKICQAINEVLRRQGAGGVRASLDWDEHPVIQAVRRERADTAAKYFAMGVPLKALNDYLDLELPACPGWEKGYLSTKIKAIEEGEEEEEAGVNLDDTLALMARGEDAVGRLRELLEGREDCGLGIADCGLLEREPARPHLPSLRYGAASGGDQGRDGPATLEEGMKGVAARFGRELMKARTEALRQMEANPAGQPFFDAEAFSRGLCTGLRPVIAAGLREMQCGSGGTVIDNERAGAFLEEREAVWREEARRIGQEIEEAAGRAEGSGKGDAVRSKFNEIARRGGAEMARREYREAKGLLDGTYATDRSDQGRDGPANLPSTLRRLIHPEVRIVDARRGIVDYVASDETIDSYREVIRAAGWRFTHFSKNAPFVDSHDYSTIGKCLGRVIDFRVEGGQLIERVQWAIDVPENQLAQIGWKMTAAGYLKAVSVGFFPVKYVTPTSGEEWRRQLKELGLAADAPVRTIYTEQEQVELSCCVVGSNPNALAKALRAGAINRADIETLSQEYSQRENGRAADCPAPAAPAPEQARARFLEELERALQIHERTP
jgi:phage portal protein BeeE